MHFVENYGCVDFDFDIGKLGWSGHLERGFWADLDREGLGMLLVRFQHSCSVLTNQVATQLQDRCIIFR